MASQKTKKRRWILLIALLSGFIFLVFICVIVGMIYYFKTKPASNSRPSIKDSTPGTQMILTETGRITENGKPIVYYQASTSGISPQNDATIIYYPLGKEAYSMGEVEIDARGRIVDPQLHYPITFKIYEFLKGEPYLLGLISSDGNTKVYTKIVPHPIESTGEGGCKVSIELMDDHGIGFIILGEGFISQEILQYTSNSEGEILTDTIDVWEDGKFRLFFYPAVIGKLSGTDEIQFRGHQCETTIRYEWGPRAMDNYP